MRITTLGSILVIGIAGAAIAQVSQAPRRGSMGNRMMNHMMSNDMSSMRGGGMMSNGTGDMQGNMIGAPTETK